MYIADIYGHGPSLSPQNEVGSLVRCCFVWDSMPVDQAFHNPPIIDAGWDSASRRCKPISGIGIYCLENKPLTLPGWKGPNVVNLPLHSWLVSSRNSVTSTAQCWSLWLAGWIFRGSSHKTGLQESESRPLTHASSPSPPIATPSMCPLCHSIPYTGDRMADDKSWLM